MLHIGAIFRSAAPRAWRLVCLALSLAVTLAGASADDYHPPGLSCGLAAVRQLARLRAIPYRSGDWAGVVDGYGAREGLSLRDPVDVAGRLGLTLSGWKADLGEVLASGDAAILHLRRGHFIVLIDEVDQGLRCIDPQGGIYVCSKQELADQYSGMCLLAERAPPAGVPALLYEHAHWDAGVVLTDRTEHVFSCTNTSQEAVRLQVGMASPKCRAASSVANVLAPGQLAEITVEAESHEPRAVHFVEILSDDPARPIMLLTISMVCPWPVVASHESYRAEILMGETRAPSVTVSGPLDCEITSVSSSVEGVRLLVDGAGRTSDPGHERDRVPVGISISDDLAPGTYFGEFVLSTDDVRRPKIVIPASIIVRPPVLVHPRAVVFFGEVARGSSPTRRLVVTPLLPGVTVADARATGSSIEVEVDTTRPSGEASVLVSLARGVNPGPVVDNVEIVLEGRVRTTVNIPVYAEVKDD